MQAEGLLARYHDRNRQVLTGWVIGRMDDAIGNGDCRTVGGIGRCLWMAGSGDEHVVGITATAQKIQTSAL